MRLVARAEAVRTREPFVIARETRSEFPVVRVRIEHAGVAGEGEGAPIERYGESAESNLAFLEGCDELLGDDPFALEAILALVEERPGERAAKAALDGALHDLAGKLLSIPAWRLLGLPRVGPPTTYTVWLGDPDDMARRAEAVTREGRFRRLKLKLGARDGRDVERVRAVRGVTGLPLQVDVNEYWTLDEALDSLPALAELGVDYCEQPLPAGDEGGVTLKDRSPIPIYVDEDCHVAADVPGCERIAHGVNVKLAKSGGIREAVRIVHAARALGLGCMLGCMVESGLGIAAGAQIASLFDHVDLDGNLLLERDPWPGVELADGIQLPPEAPGLGVRAAGREPGPPPYACASLRPLESPVQVLLLHPAGLIGRELLVAAVERVVHVVVDRVDAGATGHVSLPFRAAARRLELVRRVVDPVALGLAASARTCGKGRASGRSRASPSGRARTPSRTGRRASSPSG